MRARQPQLKVVVVSGYLDLVTRGAALDRGTACWPKPVSIQQLRDRTAALLGTSSAPEGR